MSRLTHPLRATRTTRAALLAATVVAAASAGWADEARPRDAGAARGPASAARPAFDFARPLSALALDADAVAARLGSFAWEGRVTWSVARPGTAAAPQTERHEVRQLATGEFTARADLDPGRGPGSETGKQVVFTGGATYARSRWAPFRERPTDRGARARRTREQSFQIAGDVAALYGPALQARVAGETTVLGRRARRFVLSLSGEAPGERPRPEEPPPGGYDDDTKQRLAFLEGRVPAAAQGELLLDAESGVPLAVKLRGAFSEKADPQLGVEVDLDARVTAIGRAVPAVERPATALPDDRKPKGVAQALEAAGLRKRPEKPAAAPAREEDDEP